MDGFENNEQITETVEETTSYDTYSQPENTSKAFAITSLVCGIVSILLICCTWIGLIVGVTALVFGILSIRRGENAKGMAIAGIVCSSIAIVVIVILLIVAAVSPAMSETDVQNLTQQLENMFD